MKRPTRGIWLIILGSCLAAGVGWYAQHRVSRAMQATSVVVASRNIPPFTQITAKDVQTTTRPASGVPDHAASTLNQVVGTFTQTLVLQGNPIQKGQLALEGGSHFSSVLTSFAKPDIRAFAIPSKNPMIQRIHPGDRVDLYALVDDTQQSSSFLVAENVWVLGIARQDNKAAGLILALTQPQIKTILPVMKNIEISLVPDNVPEVKLTGKNNQGKEATHGNTNQSGHGDRNQ